ncbi:hypothetical protein D0Q53_20635 [Salmonella enterica]|nr:hypothetical protein [Salmonella enterica]EBL0923938.1 hypothetical protein [Salmonella enterica]ECO7324728.1 hypothetical protein [Salmonella enterica]ECZ0806983.1 hypothetical protein [Salmonella enterica]
MKGPSLFCHTKKNAPQCRALAYVHRLILL